MKNRTAGFFLQPTLTLLILTVFVSACGGGGGGDDTSSGAGGAVNGTYTGVQTLALSSLGIPMPSETTTIELSVDGNNVAVNDADFPATGKVSGQTFTAETSNVSFMLDGLSCTSGNIIYTGNVTGTSVAGEIAGPLICNGVDFALNGTFQAALKM